MELVSSVETNIVEVCRQLESHGYVASDIKAVGICNQRETTVVWD